MFLALGAWLAWQGTQLGIQGMIGPGKGFFAFWVGLAMTLFAALWLVLHFNLIKLPPIKVG